MTEPTPMSRHCASCNERHPVGAPVCVKNAWVTSDPLVGQCIRCGSWSMQQIDYDPEDSEYEDFYECQGCGLIANATR